MITPLVRGGRPLCRIVIVALALTLTGVQGAGAAKATCARAQHQGGEWRSYGHDSKNTRHQPLETTIGPDNAAELALAWKFSNADYGGGVYDTTPVVADGCVYLASSSGRVMALNADTGAVVWDTQLIGSPSDRGGAVVGAVGLYKGRVLVNVNLLHTPFLVALDQATGAPVWKTVYEKQDRAFSDTSVVLHDGLALLGFSVSAEREPPGRGGFAIVDASTGRLLAKTYTIPNADYKRGYAGATIWGSAAVDKATGYAFVGTSNPHSNKIEHRHANAILKIDLDRGRKTFGKIVDVYKGLSEQYVDGLQNQPACEQFGDEAWQEYGSRFSLACLQLDIDFGASPNLFRDARGNLMVGALQKAGVYHAAHADTMQRAWTTTVGAPCMVCNAGSTAYDGERIFGAAVPPGQMYALEAGSGRHAWVTPTGNPVLNYQPTSVANGVVYNLNDTGTLNGYDADTGFSVLQRQLSNDTGELTTTSYSASGIAIARNTVYVAAAGHVLAYRLP